MVREVSFPRASQGESIHLTALMPCQRGLRPGTARLRLSRSVTAACSCFYCAPVSPDVLSMVTWSCKAILRPFSDSVPLQLIDAVTCFTHLAFVHVRNLYSWDDQDPLYVSTLCSRPCMFGLQLPIEVIKKIPGPVTPDGPKEVPGQKSLTQELNSGAPLVNEKAETRGL